jgi:LysM repeat protein
MAELESEKGLTGAETGTGEALHNEAVAAWTALQPQVGHRTTESNLPESASRSDLPSALAPPGYTKVNVFEQFAVPVLPNLQENPLLREGREYYAAVAAVDLRRQVPDQQVLEQQPAQGVDQTRVAVSTDQAAPYTVKQGDSLWKIAKEHLEPGANNNDVANYVEQIVKENHIRTPNLIHPGDSVKLSAYAPPAHHETTEHHDGSNGHHGRHHKYHHEHNQVVHHTDSLPKNQTGEGDKQQPSTSEPESNKPKPAPFPEPSKPEDGAQDSSQPVKDEPIKTDAAKPETHTVVEELQQLQTIAHQQVHDRTKFRDIETNAKTLAATEQQKTDLYKLQDKSISDDDAHSKARTEITDTLKQAQRLLLADGSAKLNRDYLQTTAAEILHHAAHPDHIDQGHHNTCQTTAMESELYKTEPSKVAKVVADVALTGQFTAYDGTAVKIDPKPQDMEAMWYPPRNGERDLASQIFQNTAINLAWAVRDPTGKTHYEQLKQDPNSNYAMETLVQEAGAQGQIDAGHEHDPDLHPTDLAVMHRLLTGKPQEALVVEAQTSKGCDLDTVCVNSAENLGQILQQRQGEGRLPVMLYVNTAADSPFKQPNDSWHAILVTNYTDGPNPKVQYYNWWGSSSTNQEIGLDGLYKAMHDPKDS